MSAEAGTLARDEPTRVVVLSGASASGKSRLLNGVLNISRASGVLSDMHVAKRYTTRATRENESLTVENEFLDRQAFLAAVADDDIDVSWSRPISPVMHNMYGFALRHEMRAGGLLVLSANNYLNWTEIPLLRKLREAGQLIVVRVYASEETRAQRLRQRRPPVADPELTFRLNDVPDESLPPADHVIPNDPVFQAFAEWDFARVLTMFRSSLRVKPMLEAATYEPGGVS